MALVNNEGVVIKPPKNKFMKCSNCGKIILPDDLWLFNINIIHCTCSYDECKPRRDDERKEVRGKTCCPEE